MVTLPRVLIAACLGTLMLCPASAAKAECTTLYYSVNDYGKDGPAKDAQDLLDKYIVKWATNKGVKKYTAGKKDVKCELFLDFIAFNEYTCQASSKVCW
ncbi:MAG: hypothetical protein WBP94_18300 [Rhodomicrobiaceae bacterium]